MLAKLFSQNEKTTDLYALLGEQPDLILPELETVFISSGQYNALCSMYQARGMDEKLLNAWARYYGDDTYVSGMTLMSMLQDSGRRMDRPGDSRSTVEHVVPSDSKTKSGSNTRMGRLAGRQRPRTCPQGA